MDADSASSEERRALCFWHHPPPDIRRVLIYRLGSLGDTLVAIPALRFIRSQFPQARITILTNEPVSGKAPPMSAIVSGAGLCDDFMGYPAGLRSPAALMAMRKALSAARFQVMFWLNAGRGLPGSFRDLLFFKCCGIRAIIGIPFHRRDLWPLQISCSGFYESESARLIRRIGASPRVDLQEDTWWDLRILPEEMAVAESLLRVAGITRPFLAVCVGTKISCNDWGERNWTMLLRQVVNRYPTLPIIFLGAADEREKSDVLALASGAKNFCGACSPRVSAALLRKARLFVGHDSGPMHLAATVGTPCVSIFSARNPPGRWFPRGDANINLYPASFFRWDAVADIDYQKKAIYSITVKDVFDAICRSIG